MADKFMCTAETIPDLGPSQVKELLDSDRAGDLILLDVREREEYEAGHIAGAKWIPLGELEIRARQEIQRDKRIIVYCRSGRRSLAGAILLCNLGFTNLSNMEGGILSWPFETVVGPPDEGIHLFTSAKAVREILVVAFQAEYGSWTMYHTLSTTLEDDAGILKHLKSVEEHHMDILHSQMAKYWDGTPPSIEELRKSTGTIHLESGISLDHIFPNIEGIQKDSMELIEIAIETEAKAYDLYMRIAESIEEGELRQVFRELAVAEKGHLVSLSRELKRFI